MDSRTINLHLNLLNQLKVKYKSCFHCGGYYGPCFGDPVCATCHDFLCNVDRRLLSRRSDRDPPGLWPPPPADGLANRIALLSTPRVVLFEESTVTHALMQRIPAEIWQMIFGNLDDVSLFMASEADPRWKEVIMDQFSNEKWNEFVKKRWPLHIPSHPDQDQDWYSVYADLMNSVTCKLCFMHLAHNPIEAQGPLPDDDNPNYFRFGRLRRELREMKRDVNNPNGIAAVPLDTLSYNWLAKIPGPPQSAYQGGVFYLSLKIPKEYSFYPPVVRFLTKVFHPNVSRHGDIGISCLRNDRWVSALCIQMLLVAIQSLLTDPNVECSMEHDVADLYRNDPKAFNEIAKVWTSKYAMH